MSEQALEAFAAKRAEREGKTKQVGPLEGGEFLTVKVGISPLPALRLAGMRQKVADWQTARQEAVTRGAEPPGAPFTDEEIYEAADNAIRGCLTADSLPVWDRLCDPTRDLPYTQGDMYWMADILLAASSEFPTEQPVDSSTGPQAATPTSKARSGSKAGRSR